MTKWLLVLLPFLLTANSRGERWHEIGEIEREGKWHQFIEMDLRRVGS